MCSSDLPCSCLQYILFPSHDRPSCDRFKASIDSVPSDTSTALASLIPFAPSIHSVFIQFANKDVDNAPKVYGNSLIAVGFTSLLFSILIFAFQQPVANILHYNQHPEYIWMLGLSVALDAFSSIPFVYLRFIKRPYAFAGMKLFYILLSIILNVFFLVLCPWLMKVAPNTVSWFYNPTYGAIS